MIQPNVLNFLIVWAYILIGRLIANTIAALTPSTPIGQALSLIAA